MRLQSSTAWFKSQLADMTEQRNKAAEHTADLARALRIAEEKLAAMTSSQSAVCPHAYALCPHCKPTSPATREAMELGARLALEYTDELHNAWDGIPVATRAARIVAAYLGEKP